MSQPTQRVTRWQWIMLPIMTLFIIVAAIFFIILTINQLEAIRANIVFPNESILPEPSTGQSTTGTPSPDDYQRAYFVLEGTTLERRYHLLSALLLTRTWIKYLGFITGMILAFIGGTFVLGKLQEEVTSVDMDASPIKVNLQTTSPGILMAAFGVALMIITVFVNHDISFQDGAVYVQPTSFQVLNQNLSPTSKCLTQKEQQLKTDLTLKSPRSEEEQSQLDSLKQRFEIDGACF